MILSKKKVSKTRVPSGILRSKGSHTREPTRIPTPVALSPKAKALAKESLKRAKRRKYLEPFTGFQAFCEEEMKILPKESRRGFIPLEFNEAQILINEIIEEQRAKTGRVRVIILKARQQGISTLIAARVFWNAFFHSNLKAVVMAHDAPTSEALFDMSKNVITNMSDSFRPTLEKSSAREILFESNNSGYRLYTAGSPESGRGVTPTVAHLSEVAFWPYDQKILAGLFQGISEAVGTEIILESTANGLGNEFHRLWMEAQEGKSDYVPIFIPWFLTSEYRRDAPLGFERTMEEEKLVLKFNLDDDQLYWRRLKIIESGEATFKQEYPSTPQEAFITSGASVFDKEKLNIFIPQPILHTMEFSFERRMWLDAPVTSGSLKIYRNPEPPDLFVIGADVSLGVGKDYSSAVVLDSLKRVFAIYRNNFIDPSMFGDVLFYLSRMFNNGMLGVESNSMGIATNNRLIQLQHQNLYYPSKIANTQQYQSPGTELLGVPGWKTTHTSKPAIIGNLKRAVENEEIWIPSTILLSELSTFIMKENGGTEAASGYYDDTVMALAIAVEMLRTHGNKLTNTKVPFNQQTTQIIEDSTAWL